MSNKWFRLYADMIHNQRLGCVTEALRWRYVALLCLHCNGDLIGKSDDELCYSLRVTRDELEHTIRTLQERGLLAEDRTPLGWDKRQYISDLKDSTSAERQKRYRDKKRQENTEKNVTVSLRSVTRSQDVTSRPTESDTDTDIYKKNNTKKVTQKPAEVDEDVWNDFKILRKSKKAAITETALNRINTEAIKAGWTLNEALRECCARGWTGFNHEWVNKGENYAKGTAPTKTERAKAAIMRGFADSF